MAAASQKTTAEKNAEAMADITEKAKWLQAKAFENQGVKTPLCRYSKDDNDPLFKAVEKYKTELDAIGAEIKTQGQVHQNIKALTDKLNTHVESQFNSWMRGEKFDQKAWEDGFDKLKTDIKNLKDDPQVKKVLEDEAKKPEDERKLKFPDLDAIQKKALAEETEKLKRNLDAQYFSSYSAEMAAKLKGNVVNMWREIAASDQQNDSLLGIKGIGYTSKLHDGVYHREGSEINVSNSKGVLRASFSNRIFTTNNEYKAAYSEMIDMATVGLGAKSITITYDNPKSVDIDHVKWIIEMAKQKGVGVVLDSNIESFLMKNGKLQTEIHELVKDVNIKQKVEESKLENGLEHKVVANEVRAEKEKLNDKAKALSQAMNSPDPKDSKDPNAKVKVKDSNDPDVKKAIESFTGELKVAEAFLKQKFDQLKTKVGQGGDDEFIRMQYKELVELKEAIQKKYKDPFEEKTSSPMLPTELVKIEKEAKELAEKAREVKANFTKSGNPTPAENQQIIDAEKKYQDKASEAKPYKVAVESVKTDLATANTTFETTFASLKDKFEDFKQDVMPKPPVAPVLGGGGGAGT